MLLPAPVDIHRSVGAFVGAGSKTSTDLYAQRAASDESRQRRRHRYAVDGAALPPLAPVAEGAEWAHEERAPLLSTPSARPARRLPPSRIWTGSWLAGVATDGSAHPSKRRGLAEAVVQLRGGVASVLVLDERTYGTTPDCLWLKATAQCARVALFVAANDPAGDDEAAVSNVEPDAAFVQMVGPIGLSREDQG